LRLSREGIFECFLYAEDASNIRHAKVKLIGDRMMKIRRQTLATLVTLLAVINVHALEPLKGESGADAKKGMGSPGKKMMNVLFKQTPQGPVYFDFYFPDTDSNSNKPVVLFTHGGGWAAGDKSKAGTGSFNTVHRALLKKGFCVLSVGYRKVAKGGDTAMRDCVIDAKDALRYISAYKKELGIDPNRIYTFGDSAGGHLAQMVLLSPPDNLLGDPELAKYAYKTVAGVSWYGPCDFQDPQLFNPDDRENFKDRFGARIMGGDSKPEDKEKRYREMSPVSYLTKDSPALLMFQGDKDTTIPVKQAYRMQEALKTITAPVEIIIVKNAGHNFKPVDGDISPSRGEIIEHTIQFFIDHQ
jgi:acetyl esterase/lipase